MTRFPVPPPVELAPPRPDGLGRLAPALAQLAALQGGWPPVAPRAARTVVVAEGTDLAAGVAEADAAADAGVDLLVLGSSGDAVPGLVAAAVLLGLEPVEAVGTSAGPAWAARTVGVRRGVVACRAERAHPERLLAALASPPLERLTGLLAQSAVRRTPVLLDGSPLVAGAAQLASRLAPGAQAWWLAGQAPPAPAAARALSSLGLPPLLDLGLERPEGAELAHDMLVRAIGLVGEQAPSDGRSQHAVGRAP